LALAGYKRHREFAVSQIISFIDLYQILDGPKAAKIVYVLIPFVRLLDTISIAVFNNSKFNQLARHFIPSHVIEGVKDIFTLLCKVIKTREYSLKLSIGHEV